jgi:hypothetical protein
MIALFLSVLFWNAVAVKKVPPSYNGELRHFIADLGPMYPCHPFFDMTNTWVDWEDERDDYETIRNVLNGLSKAGFNGVRLPMWPYSDEVRGSARAFGSSTKVIPYNNNTCNAISLRILEVLRMHKLADALGSPDDYTDDNYYYFSVHWSPAFDGRRYQEHLTEF